MAKTPYWKLVEEFLQSPEGKGQFTVRAYAEWQHIDVCAASQHLQAYKDAQRTDRSKTKFMLHRVPGTRTTASIWRAGARKSDAQRRSKTLLSDVRTATHDAYSPDMLRIAQISPKLAKQIRTLVDSKLKDALAELEGAIELALVS